MRTGSHPVCNLLTLRIGSRGGATTGHPTIIMNAHDDNFGHWEGMDDPDTQAFYRQVQATNVEKECQGCGNRVRIQPQYAYCNRCAAAIERGIDL